jgi:hypothetical protein
MSKWKSKRYGSGSTLTLRTAQAEVWWKDGGWAWRINARNEKMANTYSEAIATAEETIVAMLRADLALMEASDE